MPAKRTAKKTVRKKTASRKGIKPVEKVVSQQPAIIQNTAFQTVSPQPVQPEQPIQPVIPVQPTQPIQPNQPAPVVPMQTVPMSSPTVPAQGTSTFENSTTTQPPQSVDASADAAAEGEPEIKMGTEGKPSAISTVDGKAADLKADPPQTTNDNQDKSGGKKNLILPIIFIVLLGVAVLAGLFIYRQNFSKNAEEKINEVSLSPTPIEKPTPKPVDLSKFQIQILNGSGVEGAASSQKSDLEGMGFKVTSIGNAENSDYVKTVIKAKKSVDKDFVEKLKTALEKSFEVSSETLGEEADAKEDIIVIIGSSKSE